MERSTNYAVFVLLVNLSPTGMHPFQTMRIDEKGVMMKMDVFEYLFKHAQ